jgi:hypothetical protein
VDGEWQRVSSPYLNHIGISHAELVISQPPSHGDRLPEDA